MEDKDVIKTMNMFVKTKTLKKSLAGMFICFCLWFIIIRYSFTLMQSEDHFRLNHNETLAVTPCFIEIQLRLSLNNH